MPAAASRAKTISSMKLRRGTGAAGVAGSTGGATALVSRAASRRAVLAAAPHVLVRGLNPFVLGSGGGVGCVWAHSAAE